MDETIQRAAEYHARQERAVRTLGTAGEIEAIILNPAYWRVRAVLKNCWREESKCDIPRMLRASDEAGRVAILAILAEYAAKGETGWIYPLVDRIERAEREDEDETPLERIVAEVRKGFSISKDFEFIAVDEPGEPVPMGDRERTEVSTRPEFVLSTLVREGRADGMTIREDMTRDLPTFSLFAANYYSTRYGREED